MLLLALMTGCSGPGLVDDGDVVDTVDPSVIDEEPTVDDVLAALPACVPGATDGLLDLGPGCAGDVCVGMYAADVEAALGAGECAGTDGYPGFVSCYWAAGVTITFKDRDLDGVLDADARNEGMYVYAPFAGGTAEGLASGASMSCFVDALGAPDRVEFASGPAGFQPASLYWSDWGFGAFDEYTVNDYGQDGLSDYLYVAGAPDWRP